MLTDVTPLTNAEQELLVSWQDPPAWASSPNRETTPPGRGNFLIKVGGRTGIPIHVDLTEAELKAHDTNRLWHEQSRVGTVDREVTS